LAAFFLADFPVGFFLATLRAGAFRADLRTAFFAGLRVSFFLLADFFLCCFLAARLLAGLVRPAFFLAMLPPTSG
jgi:hypothetical protein